MALVFSSATVNNLPNFAARLGLRVVLDQFRVLAECTIDLFTSKGSFIGRGRFQDPIAVSIFTIEDS